MSIRYPPAGAASVQPAGGVTEDVLLWRAFRASDSRRYVDASGRDLGNGSILDGLAANGWTGLTVVADASQEGAARTHRPADRIIIRTTAMTARFADEVRAWAAGWPIGVMLLDNDASETAMLTSADLSAMHPTVIALRGQPGPDTVRLLIAAGYRQTRFAGVHDFYLAEAAWEPLALSFFLPPLAGEGAPGSEEHVPGMGHLVSHVAMLTDRLLASEREAMRARASLALTRDLAAREIDVRKTELRNTREATEAMLAAARHHAWTLERRIETIYRSTSWRASRPLRAAGHVARMVLARGRPDQQPGPEPARQSLDAPAPSSQGAAEQALASRLVGQIPGLYQAE